MASRLVLRTARAEAPRPLARRSLVSTACRRRGRRAAAPEAEASSREASGREGWPRERRAAAAPVVDDAPCFSGRSPDARLPPRAPRAAVAAAAAAAAAAALLPAAGALAAEAAPEGLITALFATVEALGPLGPVAFVFAVATAELIPLFPTQPLLLAAGLLFGTKVGALAMMTATTIAAAVAFGLARGVGRPLAERLLSREMEEAGEAAGGVRARVEGVARLTERGTFWQQAGAVLVLRMTPLVPFSISNYLLGVSKLPFPPYLLGTAVGMAIWSPAYAALGGASRAMLLRGAAPEALVAATMERAAALSEHAAAAALVAGGVAAAVIAGAKLLAPVESVAATRKE